MKKVMTTGYRCMKKDCRKYVAEDDVDYVITKSGNTRTGCPYCHSKLKILDDVTGEDIKKFYNLCENMENMCNEYSKLRTAYHFGVTPSVIEKCIRGETITISSLFKIINRD